MIRTVCIRFYRWQTCVSRLALWSVIAAILIFTFLMHYDSGGNEHLDLAISGGISVTIIALILHMLYDRGLTYWNATGLGVLCLLIAALGIFSYFFWQYRSDDPIDPGVTEGWLDVVRTAGIVMTPLTLGSVIIYHVRLWRGQPVQARGELLRVPDSAVAQTEPYDVHSGGERRNLIRREDDRNLRDEIADLRKRMGI